MQRVISNILERMTNISRAPIEKVLSKSFNCDDTQSTISEMEIFKIIIVDYLDKLKAEFPLYKIRCIVIS